MNKEKKLSVARSVKKNLSISEPIDIFRCIGMRMTSKATTVLLYFSRQPYGRGCFNFENSCMQHGHYIHVKDSKNYEGDTNGEDAAKVKLYICDCIFEFTILIVL